MNYMKNLGKRALSGLSLLLAGIIGFSIGCSKKPEISESNYRVSSAYAQYCLTKRDIQRDPNIQSQIKSKKNYNKSDISAFNCLRNAYLKDLQGFPDSTKIYFNEMAEEIKTTDNPELKDASSLMLLLGPGYYYYEREDYENAEKFLDLAESKLTENTPKNYLRSLFECLGDCKTISGKRSDAECLYSLALKNLKHETLTKGARNRVEERLNGYFEDK